MEYTEKTTLKQVLSHEKGEEILEKYEVPCLGCIMAKFEEDELTIGAICEMYDLNLEGILEDLNKK